jgi:hypothetical protein
MKMRNYSKLILILTILCGLGTTNGKCQAPKAILLEAVQLKIQTSNGGTGSLTLPKGREVEIVDRTESSSKISVPNLTEGWVENSTLKVITLEKDNTQNRVDDQELTVKNEQNGTTPTPTENIKPNPTASLDKPSVKTDIVVNEEKENSYPNTKCKDQKITHKIKVVLSGIQPQEASNYSSKVYVLSSSDQPFDDPLKMIKLKELENNNFEFYQTNATCSCCKGMNKKFAGHAVVVSDNQGNMVTSYKTDMSKKELEFLEEKIGHSLN